MFGPKRVLSKRRILITGASSGIGRALALALGTNQNRLILTARRADRLANIASLLGDRPCHVECVPGDIAESQLRHRLIRTAGDVWGGLDILINNAGIGGIGTFASADDARLRRIMEVNFFAPAELVRGMLPLLRTSDDGLIVNVGSVLGHCAVPKKSEYCASKFALHGLNDALRVELAQEGIDVLLISPSTVRSEFFDHVLRSQGEAAMSRWTMAAETVARCTVRAMERNKREVILSLGGKLLVWADRIAPGTVSQILRRFG